jgi:hypothetical protein
MIREPITEDGMREEIREALTFLEKNIDNLTERHFTAKDKKLLREQVSLWRWYLSHGHFTEELKHLNDPRTKPPIQYLYNLVTTGRSMTELVSLCATPKVRESLDLRYGADYLKMVMTRITNFAEPVPVPKSYYLPMDHPQKTDQEGIPWDRSQHRAAVKWRKKKKAEEKAKEALKPKPPKVIPEDELEKRCKAFLKAKDEQRQLFAQQRADAIAEAHKRYEMGQREQERARRKREGG